jgi:hypothetical protein
LKDVFPIVIDELGKMQKVAVSTYFEESFPGSTEKTTDIMAGLWAENRTRNLPNKKQECGVWYKISILSSAN